MAIEDRNSKLTHCDIPRETFPQVSYHHCKMSVTMLGLVNSKPVAMKLIWIWISRDTLPSTLLRSEASQQNTTVKELDSRSPTAPTINPVPPTFRMVTMGISTWR